MKEIEIKKSVATYRTAIGDWNGLIDDLKAAGEGVALGAGMYPLLRRSARVLQDAVGRLERIGRALAEVPGLAEALRDERRVSRMLRRYAEEHGLSPRYDIADEE